MQLTLNDAEQELLEGILGTALREVREEVYHTEEHRFKDDLKGDEAMLRELLVRVRQLRRAQAAGHA
jgi:hypothetical protein